MQLFIWNSESGVVEPAEGIAGVRAGSEHEFCVEYKDEASRCRIMFVNAKDLERAKELVL